MWKNRKYRPRRFRDTYPFLTYIGGVSQVILITTTRVFYPQNLGKYILWKKPAQKDHIWAGFYLDIKVTIV